MPGRGETAARTTRRSPAWWTACAPRWSARWDWSSPRRPGRPCGPRNRSADYLIRKLDEELPPDRLRGLETTYRLFGLLPDTLQLRALLLDLYTEQVAGFYDPDSATLFGVAGSDPDAAAARPRPRDDPRAAGTASPARFDPGRPRNNDRLTAAQAILEGQATLASLDVLAPGQDVAGTRSSGSSTGIRCANSRPRCRCSRGAPLILRESLIFPYLQGAEFMHWWARPAAGHAAVRAAHAAVHRADPPSRAVRPERPAGGDRVSGGSGVLYEDVLGENEIRVVLAHLAGFRRGADRRAAGLGRRSIPALPTAGGPALVWYVIWDDQRSAGRFLRSAGPALSRTARKGYRAAFGPVPLAGRAAVRYVLAPEAWTGWVRVPEVGVEGKPGGSP